MGEFAFELTDTDSQRANIKVIGVGGGGGNAVNYMISRGIGGVKFVCANTDTQDLSSSPAEEKIQLGVQTSKGLGAGMNPEIGKASAEEAIESIRSILSDTNMLFITAGFGGGTGTGASPIIAKIAKEMEILTVGVVTKPFKWEGNERSSIAEQGLKDLENYVDSLIVIPNDRLQSLGKKITVFTAFDTANDVLLNSVQGIVELITVPGKMNLDFADVRAVMRKKGRSIMGSAVASGPDRARLAVEKAINSPLLEDINLEGASGILLNVSVGTDFEVSEFNQIGQIIQGYAAEDSKVIVGTSLSTDLTDENIRVTLVATGLNSEKEEKATQENREKTFEDLDRPITARNGLRQQTTRDMFESFDKNKSSNENEKELLDLPRFLRRQEPDLDETDQDY